jgi:hypothetical protein
MFDLPFGFYPVLFPFFEITVIKHFYSWKAENPPGVRSGVGSALFEAAYFDPLIHAPALGYSNSRAGHSCWALSSSNILYRGQLKKLA